MTFLYIIITLVLGIYLGTIWISWIIRKQLSKEQFQQLKAWMEEIKHVD